MKIKEILQIVVETITGRKCSKCKYNTGIACKSDKHSKCCSGIYPVGFERKR